MDCGLPGMVVALPAGALVYGLKCVLIQFIEAAVDAGAIPGEPMTLAFGGMSGTATPPCISSAVDASPSMAEDAATRRSWLPLRC